MIVTTRSAIYASCCVLLCVIALGRGDDVFSVQFVDYVSGPLDPSQQDLVEVLEENMGVFLYPETYTEHDVALECLNFTVVCVGDNPRCTPSGVFVFVGDNRSAEFAALQNPGSGGFAQVAVDLAVNDITIGTSLFGSTAPTPLTPSHGTLKEIYIYAIALPCCILVVLLGAWCAIRAYIKRHASDVDRDYVEYANNDGGNRGSDLGEELLARDDAINA